MASVPPRSGGWRSEESCTSRDVERWLIATFVAFTTTPVFSTRKGHLSVAAGVHAAPATFDWLSFSIDVLGRDSQERIALLTWARAKARARVRRHRQLRLLRDVPGGSVSDHIREFGGHRRTFDRRRKRACERLADARNAQSLAEAA